MTFDEWTIEAGHGCLRAVQRATGGRVGWATIWRAKRGEPVSFRVAALLSAATEGAVPLLSLCDPQGVVAKLAYAVSPVRPRKAAPRAEETVAA